MRSRKKRAEAILVGCWPYGLSLGACGVAVAGVRSSSSGFRKGSSIGLDVWRCRSGKLSLVGERSWEVEVGDLYSCRCLSDGPVASSGQGVGYAPACELPDNNTVNTCPALGGGDMLRAKARPPQTFPELHIAASLEAGQREIPSTHSRNGIPCTINVRRRPSRALHGHPRRPGVGSLWPAHLDTRCYWIASMDETRFPSSARTSKQGRRRCWKEIGCEEVWW